MRISALFAFLPWLSSGGRCDAPPAAAGEKLMRYDAIFISAGLICLLIGMSVGIWMGVREDILYAPAHAHLNLVGWVTLCLYGLIHRAYPSLAAAKLAPVQLWLA